MYANFLLYYIRIYHIVNPFPEDYDTTPHPFYLARHKVPIQSVPRGSFNSRGPSESRPHVVWCGSPTTSISGKLGGGSFEGLSGYTSNIVLSAAWAFRSQSNASYSFFFAYLSTLQCDEFRALMYLPFLTVTIVPFTPITELQWHQHMTPFLPSRNSLLLGRLALFCFKKTASPMTIELSQALLLLSVYSFMSFSLTHLTSGSGHSQLPSWEPSFQVVSYLTLFPT